MPSKVHANRTTLVLSDPRGLRRAVEMHLDSPLRLHSEYSPLPDTESARPEQRCQLVHALTFYLRGRLEPHSRVIENNRGWLCYVSRMNYWIMLPTWVQEVHRLEIKRPTGSWAELQQRLSDYSDYSLTR